MVLEIKSGLAGYPLILEIPWLAILDAYIGYKTCDMTISNGQSDKKLTLYPPTKPFLESTKQSEDEEKDALFKDISKVTNP
jgi:hypothetical protein